MRNIYFYLIVIFYVADFIWEEVLSYLNRTRMSPTMPKELEGIYDSVEYARQQKYQKENDRFEMISGGFSFVVGLLILWYGGAGWLDTFLRGYTGNTILLPLVFLGTISIGVWIMGIPFNWYDTFVIEEKFGFNKTTPRTFVADQLKALALALVLQSVLIAIIVIVYQYAGDWFWLLAWAAIAILTLTITFFYSEWIVPIFNKQTPLEEGELRSAIEAFAQKTAFPIRNIYVIDGSKRSAKSNAYFTGFGKKKRIVLYDTLINDLAVEEIVAVLAHEIGHYKMRHVIFMMTISLGVTGFMLWALSMFLENPEIAYALGGAVPSFHLGLVGFSLLYTPLSNILDFATHFLSRKHEYAADNFADVYGMGDALITGLKKISSKALSNLTPHPFVVFWSYSHPTLLQRMRNIQNVRSGSVNGR
ncbi:MAG: M48 family metallopeptidase [Synergistaceae bacterium]|jgi:STE24 endopeptidase|nr:M48 family metallopeptidase [Synergistaceae bacterium]